MKGNAKGDADSNLIPLPADWHIAFDGKTCNHRRDIDIVVHQVLTNTKMSRTAVQVYVRFISPILEQDLSPKLRDAKKDTNGYLVTVYKHDPESFKARLAERHNKYFVGIGGK